MAWVLRGSDLLTQAEARNAAQVVHWDDLTETALCAMTGAISEKIVERCGPVVYETIVDEIHEACGKQYVMADRGPVNEWTLIEESPATVLTLRTFGGAGRSVHAPRWRTTTAPYSGALWRREGGSKAVFLGDVRLAYRAGRCVDTASVPNVFKQAAAIAVRNLFRMTTPSTVQVDEFTVPSIAFPKYALPSSALELLRQETPLLAMS
jgi:hypothetical protein